MKYNLKNSRIAGVFYVYILNLDNCQESFPDTSKP